MLEKPVSVDQSNNTVGSFHVNSTRGTLANFSDFAESLHICSNKWNWKILKIAASKLKRFQKYWYKNLDQLYSLLKKGLLKLQNGIFKLFNLTVYYR